MTLRELSDLSGRTALITGGAGHIGLAAAEALIELGAVVAICDLDAEHCERTAAALAGCGPGAARSLPCDLADEAALRDAVRRLIGDTGRLDVVVHSAGYVGTTQVPGWAVPFEQQTTDAWRRAMEVNLTAPFVLVQEAREALASAGHGSVVLISSIYGMVGPDQRLYEGTLMANPVGYGVSKGGLLQLTRTLAMLLAPEVRVNAISPGGVWRQQPDSFRERYEARTPLRRMAREEDLKGAVAYLSSDLSAYVTGHNLVVDGGWTAW
jgi:NAD(P)-dependent dehydrogenase (short-subunit alcohol dehydrogenase family)